MTTARPLPRTIWICWLQGWEQAPPIVKACLATWERRNPGWEVVRLDRGNVGAHLELDFPLDGYPPNVAANFIRVLLLREHGGVWADGTLYCVAPLDSWLDPLVEPEGFFAFDRPAPDRMLANWFLAATPGQPLIDTFAESMREYWRERTEADRYFWFHQLWAEAYRDLPEFRRAWDGMPKRSANGPHYFAPDYARRLARPLRPHLRQRLVAATDPVYKLSHRLPGFEPGPDSVYEFLLSWAEQEAPPAPTPAAGTLKARMALDRGAERLRWSYLGASQRGKAALRRARGRT
ncbi:MAG TPA: capsular polysaccharide synthesis protein [Solirubrobacterales bacterium]|nr:capsular polysaccharide synthesis protein [Solirubrobacterales bacterium]